MMHNDATFIFTGIASSEKVMKANEKKEYLYRIVKFEHAVEILQGQLHFSHPAAWDDPYEARVKHPYSDAIFAQCWCKNALSDAMWRIYSPDRLGVRIRTSRSKLKDVMLKFMTTQKAGNQKYQYRIADVKYKATQRLEAATEEIIGNGASVFNQSKAADLLCLKRNAFKHESEVRAIFYRAKANNATAPLSLKIDVSGSDLVENIYIDPRASEHLVGALKNYLKNVIGFKGIIGQSGLYRIPSERVVRPPEDLL